MSGEAKLSYNMSEAVKATGLSKDTITRAVNAGDLQELDPRVEGQPIRARLFAREELERWLHNRNRKTA